MPNFKYPLNIFEERGINSAVRFTEYQRVSFSDNIPANTITLYMPDDVQCPIETEWKDGSGLQVLGETASMASSVATSALKNIAGSGLGKKLLPTSVRRKSIKSAKFLRDSTKSIQQLSKDLADFTDVGTYFTKTIPNPNPILLFSGVKLREFSMNFNMSPMSQREASEINNIINTFKGGSLPELQGGGLGLSYPNEYSIDFLFNGEKNPFMPVLKRCVITNCEAVYTGEGFWSMTRDGVPATTELQLTFKEVELVTKEDMEFDSTKVQAYIQSFGKDNANLQKIMSDINDKGNNVFDNAVLGVHDFFTTKLF